jgi:diacylglycerol O-acyltransferase
MGVSSTMGAITRPLSAEDLSILALENETVAGHTCKVMMLEDGIDVGQLRSSIAARLDRAPEFSAYLREVDGAPSWVAGPAPDVHDHVVACDEQGPLDDAALRAKIATLFEQRLDRSRPLWHIDVIPELQAGGTALICRIHHALADGQTAMRMVREVVWDQEPREDAKPSSQHRPAVVRTDPEHHHQLAALLAAGREAPQPWLRSPFNGHIGGRRAVALANADLESLKRVAHHTDGATLNDAVLTVVAGGLRRWLEAHHGHLGAIRVKVPVSLHGLPHGRDEHAAEEGNRDAFFLVDLPLGSADPLERLSEIRRATRTRKEGHDAQHLDSLMRQLGRIPHLRNFADRVLAHPRSFALNVSNVPGPRHRPSVLGVRVRGFYSLAEIRDHHALRIAVVSMANSLNFGLLADPSLIDDVDRLGMDMRAEAADLCARVQPV